jgi:hypothetical protein
MNRDNTYPLPQGDTCFTAKCHFYQKFFPKQFDTSPISSKFTCSFLLSLLKHGGRAVRAAVP